MTTGQIVGALMIAALFIGMFAVCAADIGIRGALFVLMTTIGIGAWLFGAVWFIRG